MPTDLIQWLRTCSKEERRDVALKLAQLKNTEAISELKNMTEGKNRDYTLRTWRTLWLKEPIRYDRDDQYIGIEALGETGRTDVLDYLRFLYMPLVSKENRSSYTLQGVDIIDDSWKVELYKYPNVPSGLTEDLTYEVDLSYSSWGRESDISEERIEQMRQDIPAKMKLHQIFRTAISRLESDLQT